MLGVANKTVIAILAALAASGASLGGYKVFQEYKTYGINFDGHPHEVLRVIDGDTLVVPASTKGEEVRVRLLGIDAPERGECDFTQAKHYLEELTLGKEVMLEKDITGKDRYGRLLRYVFIESDDPEADTVFVNREMVEAGLAFNSQVAPDKQYRDALSTAAASARKAEAGVWGECPELVEEKDPARLRENDSEPPEEGCTIKGNISEKGYGKLYFYPGCPNYGKITVDPTKGEAWFCSESEAERASFTKSESCDNTF